MVQLPFLLLFLLFHNGRSALTVTDGDTVLYGGSITLECSGDTALSWKKGQDENIVNGGLYKISVSGTTSTLEISKITKTTEFTCYKDADTASTNVYVANIAGVSSPICRTECEVSCTLSSLNKNNKPSTVTWSSSSFQNELVGGVKITVDKTNFTHRLEEYEYSARQTYLQIDNLLETSYFTCTFTLDDGAVLEHIVSALIRPTQPCDVLRCTDKAHCHAGHVVDNTTCRGECQKCFTYNYTLGEFIDVGQCGRDRTWCLDYLEDRSLCSNEADPIVKYCVKCGHCLKLEFSSGKLVLPLVIFISLCLLTILMCYKSYEEKRSVLPKVHVTNTEPGKIKSCGPFKRGRGDQTVIPNHLTESNQYLTPSSAALNPPPHRTLPVLHLEDPDDRPIHILELGDERMVAALRDRSRSQSLEQRLNFGSCDDVRGTEVAGCKEAGREELVGEVSMSEVRDIFMKEQIDIEVQNISET